MPPGDFFNRVDQNSSRSVTPSFLSPPGQSGPQGASMVRNPQQFPGFASPPTSASSFQSSVPQVTRGQQPTTSLPGSGITMQDKQDIYDQGLLQLQQMAEGRSPFLEMQREKMLGRQAARQTAKKGAQQQQFLQQGISPEVANALNLRQSRESDIERGGIRQDVLEQQRIQQQQAAQLLPGVTQQAMEFETQQKKQQINELISLGGAENIAKASGLFGDLYGEGVNVHNLILQDRENLLGRYASMPGISIDEAISMAKANGDLEFLGIDENQAREILQPIYQSSNPMAQFESEYGQMLQSGHITQDQYDDMLAIQKHNLLNPQGMTVSDGYVVTDDNGNEVGVFSTEGEAKSFQKENGGNINFQKNAIIISQEEAQLGKEGNIFEENGVLYVYEDGQRIKAKPALDDPFSPNNQAILDYYAENEGGDKIVNSIIAAQGKQIIADPASWPSDITEDSEIYKYLLDKGQMRDASNIGGSNIIEEGFANNSTIKITKLEGLSANSLVKMGDAIYIFEEQGTINVKGDDNKSWYRLSNPLTGESVTYTTGTDPGQFDITKN